MSQEKIISQVEVNVIIGELKLQIDTLTQRILTLSLENVKLNYEKDQLTKELSKTKDNSNIKED